MKKHFLLLFFYYFLHVYNLAAQSNLADKRIIDSLKIELQKTKEDTNRINTLISLTERLDHERDAAMQYAKDAIALSKKLHFKAGEGRAYFQYAVALKGRSYFGERGSFEEVLSNLEKALEIFKSIDHESETADTYRQISYCYINLKKDFVSAYKYTMLALKIHEKLGEKIKMAYIYEDLATFYSNEDNRPEQINMLNKALSIYEEMKDSISINNMNIYIGEWYQAEKNYEEALKYYRKANKIYEIMQSAPDYGIPWSNGKIADIYLIQADINIYNGNNDKAQTQLQNALGLLKSRLEMEEAGKMSHRETYPQLGYCYRLLSKIAQGNEKQKDLTESLKYYQLSLDQAKASNNKFLNVIAYEGLMEAYELLGNYQLAYENQRMYFVYLDSAKMQKDDKMILKLKMQYAFEAENAKTKSEQDKKDAEAKRVKSQQLLVIVTLGIIVLAVITILVILFRNNKQKQKTNTLLIDEKQKVENTLSELRSTQAQLIQSEKMASLGELTAGIAHEIQNPLNFVNNFSEVSNELMDEMKAELDKGDINEAKTIADDVKQNLEKINHHGKRADAIVKGMLQHSRTSSGQKELTDINALCDEYLRLSYHGLRAKDKSFNAKFESHFDPSLPQINVIPQDIGRVLLNLINNAFYAVNEKQNIQRSTLNVSYEPTVSISTKKINNKVEIRVKDNGNGVPQKVLDKIFQPFFTTKPTGQGTGLGLSLSYDIITKGHGGELKIQTKEGEFAEFIITL
ncbi:MAG: ATP-binding protein [Ferruginibacter sp.]